MFEGWAGKTIESILWEHLSFAGPWFLYLCLFFVFFWWYEQILFQIRSHRKSKHKGGELYGEKAEEASQ